MKKFLLINTIILTILMVGCGNKEKTLTCTLNTETNSVTVKNGKIIKNAINGEEENVTDEEWETLKNYYEFTGDEETDDIIEKLKGFNEKIGYTCTIK